VQRPLHIHVGQVVLFMLDRWCYSCWTGGVIHAGQVVLFMPVSCAIATYVLLCCMFQCGHSVVKYVQVVDQYNERWRSDWITSDFWHILNFVFLCVIAFLWRPSASATRFAYSALDGTYSLPFQYVCTQCFHIQALSTCVSVALCITAAVLVCNPMT